MLARIDPNYRGEQIREGTALYFTGKVDQDGAAIVTPDRVEVIVTKVGDGGDVDVRPRKTL
jgi:hypothetical protein